jgi:hypothetical protein
LPARSFRCTAVWIRARIGGRRHLHIVNAVIIKPLRIGSDAVVTVTHSAVFGVRGDLPAADVGIYP